MNKVKTCFVGLLILLPILHGAAQKPKLSVLGKQIAPILQSQIMADASKALDALPITVTSEQCERSAGGKHDFYSEGDYWWPDPQNPNGPYIQKDGETNPNNFIAHRIAMIRFSKLIGTLTSAYIITGNKVYVYAAFRHLKAWFIDTATKMNPSLLYAQAIKGKVTGRGVGIIDMIQMIEVSQSVQIFEKCAVGKKQDIEQIKQWFQSYLKWVTTHQYGIDEREAKNNHGTCWVMQVAAFAKLTNDQILLNECINRYQQILLPTQLGLNGSFPLELKRTKPYGYSLFNLDAMTMVCEILSTPENDLRKWQLKDGRNLEKAIAFMFPFVADKNTWTYPKDIMYWESWPVAHPFLVFGYQAFGNKGLYDTWKKLTHFPTEGEVIRNLPIRNPIIWLVD